MFRYDTDFYPLQGFNISYKWLWCNGPQMYEKIQSLNKRAKQYGLSVIQISELIDSEENNTFNSSFILWKPNNEFLTYLFKSYFIWCHLNFSLIDRYSNYRKYIHNSGLVILELHKGNKTRIVWKDNRALQSTDDEIPKKAILNKTQGALMCLDIVMEILDKFYEIQKNLKDDNILYDLPEFVHKKSRSPKKNHSGISSKHIPSKSKKIFSRLKSNDDMIKQNSGLVKKLEKMKANKKGHIMP